MDPIERILHWGAGQPAALEIGSRLNFDYPQEMEYQALAEIRKIKNTPRKAAHSG